MDRKQDRDLDVNKKIWKWYDDINNRREFFIKMYENSKEEFVKHFQSMPFRTSESHKSTSELPVIKDPADLSNPCETPRVVAYDENQYITPDVHNIARFLCKYDPQETGKSVGFVIHGETVEIFAERTEETIIVKNTRSNLTYIKTVIDNEIKL